MQIEVFLDRLLRKYVCTLNELHAYRNYIDILECQHVYKPIHVSWCVSLENFEK